jgi:hypothetical protein
MPVWEERFVQVQRVLHRYEGDVRAMLVLLVSRHGTRLFETSGCPYVYSTAFPSSLYWFAHLVG